MELEEDKSVRSRFLMLPSVESLPLCSAGVVEIGWLDAVAGTIEATDAG